MSSTRIERRPSKLTPEAYAQLCRVLERVPRLPWPQHIGHGRNPLSHGTLARRFGISRSRVSRIAKLVREGKANRQFGVRAMIIETNPRNKGKRWIRAAAVPGTPSTPPIAPASFGILDVAAMWEP